MPTSLRILVIENHDDVRRYIQEHLESAGHVVSGVRDIAGALDVLSTESLDAIFCDIHLPDGSGLGIPEKLPAKPRLCVAMSGFCSPSDLQRSRKAGFDHHLTKPFLPQEMDTLLADL